MLCINESSISSHQYDIEHGWSEESHRFFVTVVLQSLTLLKYRNGKGVSIELHLLSESKSEESL